MACNIESKMGVIYKITNKLNGKMYIGETTRDNPNERWMQHKRHVLNEQFGCRALYNAMTKHGIENFEFKIMFFCFNEDVEHYEIQMIEKFNTIAPNGYNILKGGKGGGFIGKKHSEETKEKLREHFKKKYEDVKEREKTSILVKEGLKNINISERVLKSEKWRKAVAEKRVGGGCKNNGVIPDETREKIKLGITKYYEDNREIRYSPENINKLREKFGKTLGKSVSQYDVDNKLINTFISIAEAARETNTTEATISNSLKNGNITKKGYFWRRAETS